MRECEKEKGRALRRDSENKYEMIMNGQKGTQKALQGGKERKKVREMQNERLTGRVTARGVMLKGDVVSAGTPDCLLKF